MGTLSGRPQEAQVEWLLELYRRARVELEPRRAPLPTTLPGLFTFNQWNANQPGTTLFIPVTNTTLEYINLLFIYLSRSYGFSIVDELAGGRSAGLQAALVAGRLDPARRMSIVELEQRVLSMLVVEQAFICQNLALQALGLGGWTFTGYIARHVMGGGDVAGLGFRFEEAASGPSYPVGRDGHFEAFVPPYHADMDEAVDAFLEVKWASVRGRRAEGLSRARPGRHGRPAARRRHRRAGEGLLPLRPRDLRGFPLRIDPMYQRLTVQAQHADPDFYERYYPPGALTEQHHEHFARWHPDLADARGRPSLRGGGPRRPRRSRGRGRRGPDAA